MNDTELAEALRSLGMDPDSFRALPLLPLVQVAWADGQVQDTERELILRLAEQRYALDAEGQRTLRNWLHHPPSRTYVRRGQEVLLALVQRKGPSAAGLDDVLELSQQVAKAAGGFFGIGSVAVPEAEAIAEIAAALHIDALQPWIAPDEPTVVPADADAEGDGPSPEIIFHTDGTPLTGRASLVQFDDLRGEQTCAVQGDGVTIGRSSESTVQINYDGQVSRRHCRVFERERRYYVEDLGSTRGTWVNGERVLERRLLGGETLHVGSAAFFFQLSPADTPAPTRRA